MENSLKGTRTEQNLLKAFAGESQAKNRYEFFAKKAKKEGFEQISAIFTQTAKEEQAHAKRFSASLKEVWWRSPPATLQVSSEPPLRT